MLCEQCGQNEATVQLTHYSNGEKTKKYICPACAGKMNLAGLLSSFSVNDLFDGFITLPSTKPSGAYTKRCEQCGMTLGEFKDTGKLGCANCYKSFETSIKPIIKKVQGNSGHVGKAPAGNQKYAKRREIEKLKNELNEAVRQENYELAAKLRDNIKTLEREGN